MGVKQGGFTLINCWLLHLASKFHERGYTFSVAFELQMLQEYDRKKKTRGILKANGNLSVSHQFKIALFL